MKNKMETQTKERMDELVSEVDKTTIKTLVKSVIRDLKFEGFEDKEIYEYLCEQVKEGGY